MSSSSSRRHRDQDSQDKKRQDQPRQAPLSFQASLAIAPPVQIEMGRFFWPVPVVKVTPSGQGAEMAHMGLWVMVHLLDATGRLLQNQLGGNLVTTAIILEDDPAGSTSGTQHQRSSGGSSRSSRGSSSRHSHSSRPVKPLYFAFPDLSVVFAGNYILRFDVHYIRYRADGQPENDTTVGSMETHVIKVTEWQVAIERGSPSERALLRRLRAAGQIHIPNSPP